MLNAVRLQIGWQKVQNQVEIFSHSNKVSNKAGFSREICWLWKREKYCETPSQCHMNHEWKGVNRGQFGLSFQLKAFKQSTFSCFHNFTFLCSYANILTGVGLIRSTPLWKNEQGWVNSSAQRQADIHMIPRHYQLESCNFFPDTTRHAMARIPSSAYFA